MIEIYTDGACSGNPGPGGFGIVVYEDDKLIDAYQEFHEMTTNNRMELSAIIWAMEKYGNPSVSPVVYSDSSYSVNSFTKWLPGWKENGWTRARGKKLENVDLMQKFDDLTLSGFYIDLRLVKGHASVPGNEMADRLATGKIKLKELKLNDKEKV